MVELVAQTLSQLPSLACLKISGALQVTQALVAAVRHSATQPTFRELSVRGADALVPVALELALAGHLEFVSIADATVSALALAPFMDLGVDSAPGLKAVGLRR